MADYGLAAYIIPTEDAHQSEYVGEADKRRQYISGFSGSAGIAVVTMEEQALWTDGRYFLQADQQLDCKWLLMKEQIPGTPSIIQWLLETLPAEARVGADPTLTSAQQWVNFQSSLTAAGMHMIAEQANLVDLIWTNRPPYSEEPATVLDLKFAGKSWEEKVADIRAHMSSDGTDVLVVTALDEVAWLLNLRGSDIPFNPVFRSYMVLSLAEIDLFTPATKVTDQVKNHLHVDNCNEGICVNIYGYEEIWGTLDDLSVDPTIKRISISSSFSFTTGASFAVYDKVRGEKRHLAPSPILFLKGRKNDVEIQGMKNAHIKDAVALCDFFAYMENEILADNYWDELKAAAKSEEYRAQQEDYMGLSFETISAFGSNGAIIHYTPSEDTNKQIDDTSLFLIDSGAQFKDGTTDVTRTLHFGEPTSFQIEAYTRVLMGNLDFASIVFPSGTSYSNIDILARRPLYEVGLDYRHGTSHGVGMFLFVHESTNSNYEVGSFVSDEPGYYEDGEFGIRLENVIAAVDVETPHDFNGQSLGFEAVTLVPYEVNLINVTMLSRKQCEQVNSYHAKVREIVGAELLDQGRGEGYAWVLRKTEALSC